MSKMYQVADTTGKLGTSCSFGLSDDGFANRKDAKVVRDALNVQHNSSTKSNEKPRFVVCRGEDHPRGPTDGLDHSQDWD